MSCSPCIFWGAQQHLLGQNLLIIGAPRSHSDTPHLVGLLWARDQPDADNSDNTQHSQEKNIHAPGGIRTRNPSKRKATIPRLRLLGHWDRLILILFMINPVYRLVK